MKCSCGDEAGCSECVGNISSPLPTSTAVPNVEHEIERLVATTCSDQYRPGSQIVEDAYAEIRNYVKQSEYYDELVAGLIRKYVVGT